MLNTNHPQLFIEDVFKVITVINGYIKYRWNLRIVNGGKNYPRIVTDILFNNRTSVAVTKCNYKALLKNGVNAIIVFVINIALLLDSPDG